MKKISKICLLSFSTFMMSIVCVMAATTLIFGVCGTIDAGSSYTKSSITSSSSTATVKITPTAYDSSSYLKKSWVVVQLKSGSTYVTKLSNTISLGLTSVTKSTSGTVGSGTWRVSVRQYASTGSPYVGMTADIGVYRS